MTIFAPVPKVPRFGSANAILFLSVCFIQLGDAAVLWLSALGLFYDWGVARRCHIRPALCNAQPQATLRHRADDSAGFDNAPRESTSRRAIVRRHPRSYKSGDKTGEDKNTKPVISAKRRQTPLRLTQTIPKPQTNNPKHRRQ